MVPTLWWHCPYFQEVLYTFYLFVCLETPPGFSGLSLGGVWDHVCEVPGNEHRWSQVSCVQDECLTLWTISQAPETSFFCISILQSILFMVSPVPGPLRFLLQVTHSPVLSLSIPPPPLFSYSLNFPCSHQQYSGEEWEASILSFDSISSSLPSFQPLLISPAPNPILPYVSFAIRSRTWRPPRLNNEYRRSYTTPNGKNN